MPAKGPTRFPRQRRGTGSCVATSRGDTGRPGQPRDSDRWAGRVACVPRGRAPTVRAETRPSRETDTPRGAPCRTLQVWRPCRQLPATLRPRGRSSRDRREDAAPRLLPARLQRQLEQDRSRTPTSGVRARGLWGPVRAVLTPPMDDPLQKRGSAFTPHGLPAPPCKKPQPQGTGAPPCANGSLTGTSLGRAPRRVVSAGKQLWEVHGETVHLRRRPSSVAPRTVLGTRPAFGAGGRPPVPTLPRPERPNSPQL